MSEKAYRDSQLLRTYVFVVPGNANKQAVAQAVTEQFKVTVTNVNIANSKGKIKRTVRKNGRATSGARADKKKAFVTIAEGQNIPIFAAEEAADEKAEKATKKAKKETA
jgi:large subunit ribosomal protein L23